MPFGLWCIYHTCCGRAFQVKYLTPVAPKKRLNRDHNPLARIVKELDFKNALAFSQSMAPNIGVRCDRSAPTWHHGEAQTACHINATLQNLSYYPNSKSGTYIAVRRLRVLYQRGRGVYLQLLEARTLHSCGASVELAERLFNYGGIYGTSGSKNVCRCLSRWGNFIGGLQHRHAIGNAGMRENWNWSRSSNKIVY